jgi:hypothetical protein
MSDSDQTLMVLNELVDRLDLKPGDEERAFGEIQGSPVTMTVLGADPFALLFAFRIVSPHPETIELPEEIEALVDDEVAEVSLEDGIAWLSLDDLSGESSDSIQELVESFGETLSAAGLAFPPGCVSCGTAEDVQILFVDGRCSRRCTKCIEGAFEEQEQAQEALDSASLLHVLGLPLAFLYVAAGWLLFWFLIDAILAWRNADAIVIPGAFGVLIAGVILGAVGFGLGYPLGIFLRRSGLVSRSPLMVSLPAILLACVAGEILYITVLVFRQVGVFDLTVAVRLFVPFVKSYAGSWMVLKVLVAGAIVLGCYAAAMVKKTAPLRI